MIEKGEYVLTEEQEILFEKLTAFRDGPDQLFLLTGKPGTGKTTTVGLFLEDLLREDQKKAKKENYVPNVMGAAFSHQAKKVLNGSIPIVSTFASLYGLKENYDEYTGKRTFEPDPYLVSRCMGDKAIKFFIHDEVSVYSEDMLDIMFDRTSMYSKIILMGDNAQLPPIEMDPAKQELDSPAFSLELPEKCRHHLETRVRQSEGNPILEITDVLREEIFGNHDLKRCFRAISKGKIRDGSGIDFVPYKQLNEHLEDKDLEETLTIAFRNKTVTYFNNDIRNYLLDNPNKKLTDRDVVRMADNFYKMSPDGEVRYSFKNSEVLVMEEVWEGREKCIIEGRRYFIDVYYGKVKGRDGNFITPTERGEVDYDNICEELAGMCRKRKIPWRAFWEFKGNFCRFHYSYAITAYKCQGSTVDDVYLDINDIVLTGALSDRKKIQSIYTAMTRARNRVYILKSKK